MAAASSGEGFGAAASVAARISPVATRPDQSFARDGQAPDGQEYRAFILIQALDSPDAGAMIHISLDAAQFLHDAIETVLERQRVIANSAN